MVRVYHPSSHLHLAVSVYGEVRVCVQVQSFVDFDRLLIHFISTVVQFDLAVRVRLLIFLFHFLDSSSPCYFQRALPFSFFLRTEMSRNLKKKETNQFVWCMPFCIYLFRSFYLPPSFTLKTTAHKIHGQ